MQLIFQTLQELFINVYASGITINGCICWNCIAGSAELDGYATNVVCFLLQQASGAPIPGGLVMQQNIAEGKRIVGAATYCIKVKANQATPDAVQTAVACSLRYDCEN